MSYMWKERKSEYKPLLFTTTMRTPDRIVGFLNSLLQFENHILTDDIILQIIKKLIAERLYATMYTKRSARLKTILNDESLVFSEKDLDEIIRNSPQKHKEAGFNKGWSSRFDTIFKFPMELGFIFYEINKPILISNTGHMLIDAYNEKTENGEKNPNIEKIQNVFLNAMMKYQRNNPFRKIKNENAPLVLVLRVIKLLKNYDAKSAGILKREIPLLICWPDENANDLANEIKQIRKKYRFEYSDETIYDICLKKLGASEKDKKRFKLKSICHEYVDEFIRKMRITGIISMRGMGRFIDFNTFEIDKINYILENYSQYEKFATKEAYFKYIGKIDNQILTLSQINVDNIPAVKQNSINKWVNHFSKKTIFDELLKLGNKKESKDEILREISAPTRLEFLTALALKQNFSGLNVCPNYKIDDEGLPIFTASGGMADIECFDKESNSMFEVTLLRDRSQSTNEIPAITRHLRESADKYKDKFVFSVFIAPTIHQDTIYMTEFSKHKYNIDILAIDIPKFIEEIKIKKRAVELLKI